MSLFALGLAAALALPAVAHAAESRAAESGLGDAAAAAPEREAETPADTPAAAPAETRAEGAGDLPPVGSPRCVACEAPEPAPLDWFGAEAWAEIEGGELWIDAEARTSETESVGGLGRAAILIERPADAVWAVLTDFPSWPGFMPLVDASSVPRDEGNRRWVNMKYSVMFVDMEHTTVYTLEPVSGVLRWSIDPELPHSIERSDGHWQLVPLGPGRTLVRYQSDLDSGRAVPEFVQKMLMQRSLRGLLTGLREETLRRAEPERP